MPSALPYRHRLICGLLARPYFVAPAPAPYYPHSHKGRPILSCSVHSNLHLCCRCCKTSRALRSCRPATPPWPCWRCCRHCSSRSWTHVSRPPSWRRCCRPRLRIHSDLAAHSDPLNPADCRHMPACIRSRQNCICCMGYVYCRDGLIVWGSADEN